MPAWLRCCSRPPAHQRVQPTFGNWLQIDLPLAQAHVRHVAHAAEARVMPVRHEEELVHLQQQQSTKVVSALSGPGSASSCRCLPATAAVCLLTQTSIVSPYSCCCVGRERATVNDLTMCAELLIDATRLPLYLAAHPTAETYTKTPGPHLSVMLRQA